MARRPPTGPVRERGRPSPMPGATMRGPGSSASPLEAIPSWLALPGPGTTRGGAAGTTGVSAPQLRDASVRGVVIRKLRAATCPHVAACQAPAQDAAPSCGPGGRPVAGGLSRERRTVVGAHRPICGCVHCDIREESEVRYPPQRPEERSAFGPAPSSCDPHHTTTSAARGILAPSRSGAGWPGPWGSRGPMVGIPWGSRDPMVGRGT